MNEFERLYCIETRNNYPKVTDGLGNVVQYDVRFVDWLKLKIKHYEELLNHKELENDHLCFIIKEMKGR